MVCLAGYGMGWQTITVSIAAGLVLSAGLQLPCIITREKMTTR